jgi:serine/threonine protein phosphatase 1
MRVLAIGDVHGCLRAWDALLAVVAPTAGDWIVTLGDYIDRGPDSYGVLNRLLELHRGGRLIALSGNHEEMLLAVRDDFSTFPAWLEFGGRETLDSYERAGLGCDLQAIPENHWSFLQEVCVDRFEIETHFFVHGNVTPHLPLSQQSGEVLRWQKFSNPPPHCSGKIMVCGHTHQRSGLPRNLGHAVCLDTWAYGNGWLSCLDIGSGQIWQANQQGQTRKAMLDDYLEPLTRKFKS